MELNNKSIFVKEFLISTKVRPKRIEHLQGKGIISSEATFNKDLSYRRKDLRRLPGSPSPSVKIQIIGWSVYLR